MKPEDLLERGLDSFEKNVQAESGSFWARIRQSQYALIVLALATAFMQIRDLPESFSSTTLDAAAILQPGVQAKHVRLVMIDEAEYQDAFEGRSPLDPTRLSQLLQEIAAGRPSVIVVDLDTSHEMFRALNPPANVPLVLAAANRNGGDPPFEPEKPLGGTPLAANCSAALDLIPRDGRGVVRKYLRLFPKADGASVPSLEYAAGQLYKRHPVRAASKNNEQLLDFEYRVPAISARDVHLRSALPGWPRGLLNGEVVVLGGAFKEARDRHSTPVRLMDGAEIVAQGVEAEIEDTGIPPANRWIAGLLQLLAGFGLVVLYRYAGLKTAFLSSLALIPALSVGASLLLFHRAALWLALLPILFSLLVAELYGKAALYLSLSQKVSAAASKPEGKAKATSAG